MIFTSLLCSSSLVVSPSFFSTFGTGTIVVSLTAATHFPFGAPLRRTDPLLQTRDLHRLASSHRKQINLRAAAAYHLSLPREQTRSASPSGDQRGWRVTRSIGQPARWRHRLVRIHQIKSSVISVVLCIHRRLHKHRATSVRERICVSPIHVKLKRSFSVMFRFSATRAVVRRRQTTIAIKFFIRIKCSPVVLKSSSAFCGTTLSFYFPLTIAHTPITQTS